MPTPRRRLLLLSQRGLAPSVVASTAATFSGTTTVTISVPSGVANGMELLAFITYNNAGTITAPAGWDEVHAPLQFSTNRSLSVWKRVANSEPASYDWTLGTSGSGGKAMIATTAATVDAEDGQVNASSTSMTAPSITPTGAPRTMFTAYVCVATSTITADPPGMSLLVNQPGTGARLVVYQETVRSPGATGTRVATISANSGNAGHSLLLKAA